MNFEEPTPGLYERLISRPYAIYVLVSGVIVIVVGVLIFASRKPLITEREQSVAKTDSLAAARSGLIKITDLASCRSAIQQINVYLNENSKRKPPALTADQRAFLSKECLADPTGEMAEVEGGTYTLLDAYHLTECFLFRDAAQSLQVKGLPPEEQIEAAFRWTVRQVRLYERQLPNAELVPPEFVLRRGWGTALERSFVFLALLRQLGVEGCLIATPSGDGTPSPWACGALIEPRENDAAGKTDVLLFDPRMGIALPGPKGEGIATLADLQQHAEQLKALTINSDFPYDITPEQVAGSEVLLVQPVSALSPRMAVLQKDFLGPSFKVRFGVDLKESLDRWTQAVKPLHVRVAARWTGVLRRFLPPDEGGSDDKKVGVSLRSFPGFLGSAPDDARLEMTPMTQKRLYQTELAAWRHLPPKIRDLPWTSDLGQRPRLIFNQFFIAYYTEPRKPRDLVLRGDYDEAAGILVQMRESYESMRRRLEGDSGADLNKELNEWLKRAFDAFAALARAEQKGAIGDAEPRVPLPEAKRQVENVWKEGDKKLAILLEGATAVPLNVESTYLLALACHEQAVRLQARVDRDRRAGHTENPSAAAAARAAWQTASSWWHTLLADPAALAHTGIARRWQAEANLALGEKATARAQLEDVSGNLTPLEKTARLYLASRIKP